MNFGKAIEELKNGKKVAREGWNGKGMWLILIDATLGIIDESIGYPIQPCIAMKTADNKLQPGWNASQTDMLAEDWIVVG